MPPRAPHIAAAAPGSRRWSRSNSPRRAVRSENRTAARRRSGRRESEDQAWRPRRGPALYLLDDDAVDLVGNVVEAVGDLFQVIVDLDADNEIHRAGVSVFQEKLLQANIVQIIDTALQLAEFLGDRR